MKDPLDQTILQQLLWELKPRTVIEFGAYKGGSALWIADLLKLFGCQSRVVSSQVFGCGVHSRRLISSRESFIKHVSGSKLTKRCAIFCSAMCTTLN